MHRSLHRAFSAGVGVVLSIALVVAGVVILRNNRESGPIREQQITPGRGVGPTGVARTPAVPPRLLPAQAWLRDRLFLYGGWPTANDAVGFPNDAYLVDVQSGTTETLSVPPFDPSLYQPVALASDPYVVLIGISCEVVEGPESDIGIVHCDPGRYAAGIYDAVSGSWRRIELPEALRRFRGADLTLEAVGTTNDGRVVFGLGHRDRAEYWSYDPRNDAWSALGNDGVRSDGACLIGDTLHVLTLGDTGPSLAIRDLTEDGAWSRSPAADRVIFTSSPPRLACTEHGAAVFSALTPSEAMAFFAVRDQAWRNVSPPPGRRHFQHEVATGTRIVFLPTEIETDEPAYVYDPEADRWETIDILPPVTRGAIWSGGAIVGYSEPIDAGPAVDYGQHSPGASLPRERNEPGVFSIDLANGGS